METIILALAGIHQNLYLINNIRVKLYYIFLCRYYYTHYYYYTIILLSYFIVVANHCCATRVGQVWRIFIEVVVLANKKANVEEASLTCKQDRLPMLYCLGYHLKGKHLKSLHFLRYVAKLSWTDRLDQDMFISNWVEKENPLSILLGTFHVLNSQLIGFMF